MFSMMVNIRKKFRTVCDQKQKEQRKTLVFIGEKQKVHQKDSQTSVHSNEQTIAFAPTETK